MTDNSPVLAAAMQGKVQGGQQPIVGASVQLWAVGTSGYGSAAAKLGSSVATDANGSFSLLPYTCVPGTLTYITSSGGNPGAGANPNVMLAAALGDCANLTPSTTFIFIDEVTTVATAYALGQYFTPAVGGPSTADSFGAPISSQAQTGINNAFATVNNLVCGVSTNAVCGNVATGNAVISATLTGAAGTVTATPEAAKLNTIADILAACVNSGVATNPTGTCTTLFSDVVPTGGVTPTDTLQAAVYMSLNPTSNNANGSTTNLAALYALVTGTAPYVGVGAQPTDWTVGIQYTGATPLNDPQNMAADASGNIWVMNHNGTVASSLTELSPNGTPLVNVSSIGGTSFSAGQPRNEAIDTNGNVWFENTSAPAHVMQYNALTPASSIILADTGSPYGVAIDGSNNVFVSRESLTGTVTFEEFLGGTLATTALVQYPQDGAAGAEGPEYLAVDTSGNVWASNGSATAAIENQLIRMSGFNGSTACTVFPCTAATAGDTTLTATYINNTSSTGSVPALTEPWGVAAGPGGVIWSADSATPYAVTVMTGASAGTNFGSITSLNKPEYIAVDGVGNVWAANNTSSPGSVSAFVGTGAGIGNILSPVNSGTAPFTAIGFSHAGIASANGITIDLSGNVWVASQVASTGGVFEIVGAAAPTVTPIALALKNSAVGAKP